MVDYIKQTLDSKAKFSPFNAKEKLPLLFAANYTFHIVEVLNTKFIVSEPAENVSLLQIIKQHSFIEQKLEFPVAVCFDEISEYAFKKLLESKIPFIVPKKQMYLPFMGVHFTREKQRHEKHYNEKFTPSEQLVFLFLLYSKKTEFTQKIIMDSLKLSAITVSRIMEHFTKIKLVEQKISGRTGRKIIYSLNDRIAYYKKGRSYLINPVQEIFYTDKLPKRKFHLITEITALAENSMISDNGEFCVAYNKKEAAGLARFSVEQGVAEKMTKVFVMKYNARLLQQNCCTDSITTILSFSKLDDRIEIAIQEMMEKFEWYTE